MNANTKLPFKEPLNTKKGENLNKVKEQDSFEEKKKWG